MPIVRSLARRLGLDLFIEAAPQFKFFEFDHIKHSTQDWELWFMGRHVVISRL